jgi:tight adherence protein C
MAKENKVASDYELSQLVSMMAVAIDSGMSIGSAIQEVFGGASGALASELKKVLRAIDLGANLYGEIERLRAGQKHSGTGDFLLKLLIALEFGSPLVDQLESLANSLTRKVEQHLITISAKKENTMLLPLVFLILPITIIFALFPSMQYLRLS